jgi:hypothetical protein
LLRQAERVTTRRQTLDMATGELLTEMDFEPKPGLHIAISVVDAIRSAQSPIHVHYVAYQQPCSAANGAQLEAARGACRELRCASNWPSA